MCILITRLVMRRSILRRRSCEGLGSKGFGFGVVFVGWGLYCRYIGVRRGKEALW